MSSYNKFKLMFAAAMTAAAAMPSSLPLPARLLRGQPAEFDPEPHVAAVRAFFTRRPRPWRGWSGCRRSRQWQK